MMISREEGQPWDPKSMIPWVFRVLHHQCEVFPQLSKLSFPDINLLFHKLKGVALFILL